MASLNASLNRAYALMGVDRWPGDSWERRWLVLLHEYETLCAELAKEMA